MRVRYTKLVRTALIDHSTSLSKTETFAAEEVIVGEISRTRLRLRGDENVAAGNVAALTQPCRRMRWIMIQINLALLRGEASCHLQENGSVTHFYPAAHTDKLFYAKDLLKVRDQFYISSYGHHTDR